MTVARLVSLATMPVDHFCIAGNTSFPPSLSEDWNLHQRAPVIILLDQISMVGV